MYYNQSLHYHLVFQVFNYVHIPHSLMNSLIDVDLQTYGKQSYGFVLRFRFYLSILQLLILMFRQFTDFLLKRTNLLKFLLRVLNILLQWQ